MPVSLEERLNHSSSIERAAFGKDATSYRYGFRELHGRIT
jgi:hypothetical protein